MNLDEKEIKRIKALHVTTKIPVFIFDEYSKCIRRYCSGKIFNFPYDFLFKDSSGTNTGIWFNYGIYIQILYLIFDYPHKHYTFKYFEV